MIIIATAPLDAMLRGLVIGQLGHHGDDDTIKEAQKRFNDHYSGTRPLHADQKTSVFSVCLANGGSSTFDQLVQVYNNRYAW